MRSLLKKYGKYAGYALFTLLMIVYFLFLTFPYDAVKDRYLAQQTAGLPYHVSIRNIRATPLLWIRASGVDLARAGNSHASILKLGELRIRPSLFRLLTGTLAFRGKTSLYGGRVGGRVEKNGGALMLSLDWKNIELEQLPLKTLLSGAKLGGELNGEMDLTVRIQGSRIVPGKGMLKVRLAKGSAAKVQVKGFAVPDLKGITGEGNITLAQKRITVDSLDLKADLLSLGLQGKMNIARRLSGSPLNLKARIKLSGSLASQYQPMLAGFLRNRDKDGFYVFSIRGTLGSPRLSL